MTRNRFPGQNLENEHLFIERNDHEKNTTKYYDDVRRRTWNLGLGGLW
jgi:hypothetical protein